MTIQFCHRSLKVHHKKAFVTFFGNIMYYASQINSRGDFTNMS
jgi:hypothetical protein